jgi:hypothetical protein
MNLFVLVATGQRVANLPPVLEHARPGDHVLWVESAEARRGNWTAAPRALLEKRGLITADTISVPHVNDPALLTGALAPFAKESRGQYETVFLVANGGTKLSPVGLLFGLEALAPRMLYGDERPAVHSLYPAALDTAPAVEPYTRHDLDLSDILCLNGFVPSSDSRHVRIWPDALPVAYQLERYGSEEPYTYARHQEHHAWAAVVPAAERVPYESLRALLAPEVLARWHRTVQQLRTGSNPQMLASLYNSTLNLDAEARRVIARSTAGITAPVARIGDAFERAVARRVRAWLERTRHPAVRSVWADVSVARECSPHVREVQFDVLCVLTNGVLVHLECKSAVVDTRDLDVGVHRLRQAGSQLARLAAVIPIYSRQLSAPWFSQLHATRTELTARLGREHVIPFTWPGQPARYTVPGSDPAEDVECPEFEAALDGLLRPYHP